MMSLNNILVALTLYGNPNNLQCWERLYRWCINTLWHAARGQILERCTHADIRSTFPNTSQSCHLIIKTADIPSFHCCPDWKLIGQFPPYLPLAVCIFFVSMSTDHCVHELLSHAADRCHRSLLKKCGNWHLRADHRWGGGSWKIYRKWLGSSSRV